MTRSKLSTKAVLVAGAIGLSTAMVAGSQPAAAQIYSDEYSCPAGYVYDPTYGCTLPGAYEPYDYGYYGYPPYGTYGPYYAGHREFGHGFAHGTGGTVGVDRGFSAAHFGGGSFAHAGGFGGFHGGGSGGGGHR